jgi:hypothetical protein
MAGRGTSYFGKVNTRDLLMRSGGVADFSGAALLGLGFGPEYFVDTNGGSDSANGKSWANAFQTMTACFAALDAADASGARVYFVGNIREQLTTPTGVADVTIIGAGTRPRHADTHPLNGELAAATWKLPASGSTNNPLLIVRNPGWRFENILFAAHASNYAIRMDRTADEDATEQDASHMAVLGCRFASGAGGISDTGGCFNVQIEGCWFQALTTACILGVGNIGVGQLMWHIRNNHFNNFTNGVKIAGHECVITGNYFTDGGTPNTTFVLNTNNGGGRDNFVVDNFFQTATANFNTPDIVGCATDVWWNVSIDAASAGVESGHEVGQPA